MELRPNYVTLRTVVIALAGALTSAGCATSDCGSDWYSTGRSDGRVGTFAQADVYARRCPAVNTAEYNRGWRDGASERPSLGGM